MITHKEMRQEMDSNASEDQVIQANLYETAITRTLRKTITITTLLPAFPEVIPQTKETKLPFLF
jgi:hypothetical protein